VCPESMCVKGASKPISRKIRFNNAMSSF